MNEKSLVKLNNFFQKEFYNGPSEIAIIKNDDGSFEIFSKYKIIPTELGFVVTNKMNSTNILFSALKTALIWCIYDTRMKQNLSLRVEYLDKLLAGTESELQIHRKLLKNTKDLGLKLIYLAKFTEEQNKKKIFSEELSDYFNDCYSWHINNFTKLCKQ